MNEIAILQNYLLVGAILFTLGLTGFLIRRNLIVMFLCAEMMLQGISLSLIAWGRFHNDWGGQMLVIFIITVAACEAGIAMALFLMLCRKSGNLDIVNWQNSREEGTLPYLDREVPEETFDDQLWPSLTPAGVEPQVDPEERLHRTNV
jgi:NADH-quinone oxidoreductase subunit K